MNISTGISEINFLSSSSAAQKPGKIFIWPVYNSGAVTGIQRIIREADSGSGYIKPYSADLDNKPPDIRHEEYTPNGKVQSRSSSYYPGYFFNILA